MEMISYDDTNAEVISVTESSGGGRMTIIMRTDRNEESEARSSNIRLPSRRYAGGQGCQLQRRLRICQADRPCG